MTKKFAGYIGNSMSTNAYYAHVRGLFPISVVTRSMLDQYGFYYSVNFFKWLCKEKVITAAEWHHTSITARVTSFYDPKMIKFAAQYFNLPLLYQIYRGKINWEEAIKLCEIQYVTIWFDPTLLKQKPGEYILGDFIKCADGYYRSRKEKFWCSKNDSRLKLIHCWKEQPAEKDWIAPKISTTIHSIVAQHSKKAVTKDKLQKYLEKN